MKYGQIRNIKGLQDFQKKVQQMDAGSEEFLEGCVKELAARLLAKVVKRTPVGQYPPSSGKTGGTLRRGWTGGVSPAEYAQSIDIAHVGHTYTVKIINPVEYAAYVEYGHRTANHKGWVPGQFMMTISEDELAAITPQVLEARLRKYMK